TTRSINVRTQPSTSATIAINLKRGSAVAILETRGSWDRVEVSASQGPAVQGWIFNTYLTDTDPAAAQPAAAEPATAQPIAAQSVTAQPVAASGQPAPVAVPAAAQESSASTSVA